MSDIHPNTCTCRACSLESMTPKQREIAEAIGRISPQPLKLADIFKAGNDRDREYADYIEVLEDEECDRHLEENPMPEATTVANDRDAFLAKTGWTPPPKSTIDEAAMIRAVYEIGLTNEDAHRLYDQYLLNKKEIVKASGETPVEDTSAAEERRTPAWLLQPRGLTMSQRDDLYGVLYSEEIAGLRSRNAAAFEAMLDRRYPSDERFEVKDKFRDISEHHATEVEQICATLGLPAAKATVIATLNTISEILEALS